MALTERERAPMWVRIGLYLVGIVLIGVGVALMVEAELGVAPNDVLSTGLADALDTGVGSAAWISAGTAIVIAWIMGHRPRVATVLGGVVVGVAINTMIDALPSPDAMAVRVLYLVAGLAVVWTAITSIVAADVGAGPLEVLMLAIVERGVSISVTRWGMELTLLVLGLLLGGSAGLGTVVFALGTGPVLAFTLPRTTALLGTTLTQPTEIAAAGP